MRLDDLQPLIDAQWDNDILAQLSAYVRVHSKSPAFYNA